METMATDADPVLQVTSFVISWVELSVYMPVAINCCFVPLALAGLVGVTEIELKVAGVTVRAALPETAFREAEIVVEPVLIAVAFPVRPGVFEMVAIDGLEEFQVTIEVKFWWLLSE